MKKRVISILILAGLITGMIGCGTKGHNVEKTSQGEAETIRLGVMTGNIDHWIVEAGLEEGIFEKYGIQLEVTEFAAGVNTVDAIVTNQSDIGFLADYAAVNRLGNTQENTQLRMLARFVSSNASHLYVNPKEVTKLEDLSGKGVVTLPGTVWDYWNAQTYEAAGIPADEQKVVNVDSAQAALGVMTSGQGVAFWASGANARKMEEAGMKTLIDLDELGLQTEQYFVTSAEYIKGNTETIKNFLQAVKEAQGWIEKNPEKAAQVVKEKTGIPSEQFQQSLKSITLTLDFNQDTIKHLSSIKNWALENGIFDQDFEITDYADTTLLKELFPTEVGN